MDLTGLDESLAKTAHSISPIDPAHTWAEVAEVIGFNGSHTRVFRCTGCNQERWVPI